MPESVLLDGIDVEYTDAGSGSPIVFVHGVYVTGALWDDVAQRLSTSFRCLQPTWPFGAQRTPAGRAADLGVIAAGKRIVGFLDALDLFDVTLVVNDTGGGIVLSALGNASFDFGRVGRLVITNCDSYDHFPPPAFSPLVKLCRLNATLGRAVLSLLATNVGLRFFASSVTRYGIDTHRIPAIFGGFKSSAAVRADAARLTADLNPAHSMAAVEAIEMFDRPVLMVWGRDDKLFPLSDAERLADAFPDSSLQVVDDSSTYVMLDQPNETAEAISTFIRAKD